VLTDSRLGLQGSSLADAAAGTTGFNPPKREVRNALQELNQAKAQRKTFSKTKQPELAFVAKHYTGTSGHDCPSSIASSLVVVVVLALSIHRRLACVFTQRR